MSCIVFGAKLLRREDVEGKRVIEVGSYDVNGSLRPLLTSWKPAEYVGSDIVNGPGVDVICEAEKLVDRFGEGRFDLVVCTEVLEHTRYWRSVVHNLKHVTAPGGLLLVTTRGPGFAFHAWPNDFWRYDVEDFGRIFSDFEALALEADPEAPGVFTYLRRPADLKDADLSGIALNSMLTGRRELDITDADFKNPHYQNALRRERFRETLGGMKRTLKQVVGLS
jgi:SAM-dependent methyltransferase